LEWPPLERFIRAARLLANSRDVSGRLRRQPSIKD
jgi:hypothetical protein